MPQTPMVRHLARFATRARPEDLSSEIRAALKVRILDSLACAVGATKAEPIARLRRYVETLGGTPHASLIGGGRASADRAALYNGYLIRYLDFNDSFLAPRETCHPSDNIAPVLAACEYADAPGSRLLTALAVAYQVQCRLSEVAPVRDKGFDHTVQGSYAAAAGVARALELDEDATANAIAISGTAFNALRVTRTGALSHWKGLAYPNTAFSAVHAAFMAREGITGPPEVFEGNKGFMHTISGPFSIDWENEDLSAVRRTAIKKYNAEVHSQSVLEALEELRTDPGFSPEFVQSVEIHIFDVAYNIIGGGEEGQKHEVYTKEQADHSLPYMAAVMLLDGEVTPRQYRKGRILAKDVRDLMSKIRIHSDPVLSQRFPKQMPCRVRIELDHGDPLVKEKSDYHGYMTRPATWESVTEKLRALAEDLPSEEQNQLLDEVAQIDTRPVRSLTGRLAELEVG